MGKLLLLAWLPILLAGCSTAFTVKSDPLAADLYVIDIKTGEKKSLGKTPFEAPMASLRQSIGDATLSGEYFSLVVEKKDYVPQTLMVPVSRFGTLVTAVDVKLKKGNSSKEAEAAKDVLDRIFLAQKLALAKEYERAQIELDRVLGNFPEFPRALSMRASIYFVQKNYAESLKWYELALKADPQMEDAVKMVAKIRALTGNRLPATGGKP